MHYNPKNYKALFRKARALKEQGYFEKATKILEEIVKDGEEGGELFYPSRANVEHD